MVRVKLLGAGAVAGEYTVPALRELGLLAYTLVADCSLQRAAQLRRRHPDAKVVCCDFRKALDLQRDGSAVEIALVALPNSLHFESVLEALDRNYHVLCEKPLTLSSQGCLDLAERAQSKGRVLAVNMVRRFLPSWIALREAIVEGGIGLLRKIDIAMGDPYAWPSDSGAFFKAENGGVFSDMGVHYLDLIEEILGRLDPISYWDDWEGGVEANALFQAKSPDGVQVELALSRTRHLRNTALFSGTQGELFFGKDQFENCSLRSAGVRTAVTLFPKKIFSIGKWTPRLQSCFAWQLLEFMEKIQSGKGNCVEAGRAASTVALIEWAYRSRKSRAASAIACSQEKSFFSGTRAVVTGGTGFIGSHLVERLFRCEEIGRVTVPVRGYRTCAEVARFPVVMPRTNLLCYKEVEEALRGSRWVFHCAYGKEGPHAGRVTVQGTQNVVNSAVAMGCEAVVVLSSVVVFGRPDNSEVDETWPYQPALGEYGRSKAEMERWCLERAKNSGWTRIAVLNPSCVYGPGGGAYSALPARLAREGSFCWINGGEGIANYTYVENLIDAMLKAATCPQAHGRRFIINDGSTTWKEFLAPLLREFTDLPSCTRDQLAALQERDLGELIWRSVPVQFLKDFLKNKAPILAQRFQSSAALRASAAKHKRNPPLWLTDLFGPYSTRYFSEKARRILRWKPKVDLETGQKITLEWLQQ